MAAHVLQVLGLEEHHRPVGADQGEGGGAGAEVGAVAEEVEFDDRRADPVLDRPEGGEGERRRRAPSRRRDRGAPGLRLDQRQDDGGEADAERRQPGPVDPRARAGVGRLGRGGQRDRDPERRRPAGSSRRSPASRVRSAGRRPAGRPPAPPPRPRPRSRAPAAAPRSGRRCRPAPARARASAPPRPPAGPGRGSACPGRRRRRRRPSRAANRTIPARKTRLRPNMSPSRPAVTTSTAIVSR